MKRYLTIFSLQSNRWEEQNLSAITITYNIIYHHNHNHTHIHTKLYFLHFSDNSIRLKIYLKGGRYQHSHIYNNLDSQFSDILRRRDFISAERLQNLDIVLSISPKHSTNFPLGYSSSLCLKNSHLVFTWELKEWLGKTLFRNTHLHFPPPP